MKNVDFETESNKSDLELEKDVSGQIIQAIGPFGKWQLKKCIFVAFVIFMPATLHLLKMIFYRAETEFWCQEPERLRSWVSEEMWKDQLLPKDDACSRYATHFYGVSSQDELRDSDTYKKIVSGNMTTAACTSFDYNRTFWISTIVQEWDLICDKEEQQKLTQQCTFIGLLFGVIISGIISDRYGRIKALLFLLTILLVSGTVTSFAQSYATFLAGITFSGFASIGFGTVMYCWMMELIAGHKKTIFGCMGQMNFALWGFVLVAIAALVPNWRHMEMIFTFPLVLLYATYWILPESPRKVIMIRHIWLMVHGQTEEAEKILREIAEHNGKPLSPDFHLHHPEHHHTKHGKGLLGIFTLFKTPNLRMKTIILYYLWFATSIVYYGLTLNSNNKGSLMVVFTMGKTMEVIFLLCVMVLLIKSGRRITTTLLFAIAGLSLTSTAFVPDHEDWQWLRDALNVLGRGSSVGSFCLCYVYSAEIYPTVVRSAAIGSSSFWARVGPIIAPYIADLKVYDQSLPIVVFGIIALLACFLVTFLPETAHHKLPDTMHEGEEMGKGDNLYTSIANCRSKRK